METVNRNILARLKKLGLKRKQAADQLKIDVSYFYKMLAGERRWQLEYLEAVANLLKVPLWKLFYPESEETGSEGPDLVLGTTEVEIMSSDEYARLPVVSLQVSVHKPAPYSESPPETSWVIFVRKNLLEGITMGKSPAAVELGLKVC